MKRFALGLIRFYQHIISPPLHRSLGVPNACKFTPTCSEYMYDAVDKYGAIKGSVMGIKRVLSCHPFSKGGYHPVR